MSDTSLVALAQVRMDLRDAYDMIDTDIKDLDELIVYSLSDRPGLYLSLASLLLDKHVDSVTASERSNTKMALLHLLYKRPFSDDDPSVVEAVVKTQQKIMDHIRSLRMWHTDKNLHIKYWP